MTPKSIDLVDRAARHLDLNAAPRPEPVVTPNPEPPVRAAETVAGIIMPDVPDSLTEPVVVQATGTPPQPKATAPRTPAGDPPTLDFNWIHLEREGFLTPENQRSLIAEEFRIIKRPLLRSAFGRDRRAQKHGISHVVMITSPAPGDGKTFTAINLALSIASERDLHVLLIDCDARRKGLSRTLGIGGRAGLIDVLTNPSLSIADVMIRTDVPNLAVVPAGQIVDAPTEIFASQSMGRVMGDIATRYVDRFIIFDAPPALASSETGVLASHVGHVLMVVQANETSRGAVAQSVAMIDSCPNISFILNRVTLSAGTDRFGGYGYYEESGAQWLG